MTCSVDPEDRLEALEAQMAAHRREIEKHRSEIGELLPEWEAEREAALGAWLYDEADDEQLRLDF